MKKVIGFILSVILLANIFVGCAAMTVPDSANGNDYEKAKDYVISYANAVLKAWNYGLKDDCIFEDETIKDTDSPLNVDLDQLVEVTGFNKSDIETFLHRENPEFSYKTVVKYCNKYCYLHQDGKKELETYNTLHKVNGKKPELDDAVYYTIMYNLEMVKLLFENIGKSECEAILSQNGSSNVKYQKVAALYEYIKNVHATCLDNSQYKYLFPSNFQVISQEIQTFSIDLSNYT